MAKNINDIKETNLGSIDELTGSTDLTIEEKASLDDTLFDGLPSEEEINSGEDVHYDSEELRKLFNDEEIMNQLEEIMNQIEEIMNQLEEIDNEALDIDEELGFDTLDFDDEDGIWTNY